MKRISFVLIFLFFVALGWYFIALPKAHSPHEAIQSLNHINFPRPMRLPASKPLMAAVVPPKASTHLRTIKLPEDSFFVNEKKPLNQNGEVWKWLEGVVAIKSNHPGVDKLPQLARRAGFVLVAAADAPENAEQFELVEREDNGLKGIFTGTIKAMGLAHLTGAGQFLSQCPVELLQFYPSINSYLLKVKSSDSYEDSMSCLKDTGLFKHLEWEILVAPHVPQ